MTLRARLLALALLLVTILGISGYLVIRNVERSELHQIDNQLNASRPIATGIARAAPAPSDGFRIPPRPNNNTLSDIYVATISNGTRRSVVSPQAAKGEVPRIPSTSAASIGAAKPQTVDSMNGSGRWRAVLLDTPDGRQVLIAVYMAAVDATANELRTTVLVAGAVVAAILLAGAFWIERLGLRPIGNMKRVAEAILAGDRTRRVTPPSVHAETADLATALNSMLDQQNAIEDRLRQFVADASHELRTPTAAISGLTQLWRQGELRDGDALQDAMRRIGQESARMKALVEELLLLARLDEGMPLGNELVNLSAVVDESLETASSAHPSRQITTSIEAGVTLPGEVASLRRVVTNLITNALIHTPPSSAITVRLAREKDHAVLEVADSGPGMDPADAEHAFDRFWRAEASRTRTGSGLGLSIAQAIVAAHGGQIHLRTTRAEGTRVRVELDVLPIASEETDEIASPGLPADLVHTETP